MLSNYNRLQEASIQELRIAEASLRSELKNRSHPQSVHKAARKNLAKVLAEIRKR